MEEVYKKYWNILVADAFKKTNDHFLAEDCAQETMIFYFETLQKGGTFADEKQRARFLFKVNQNHASRITAQLANEKKLIVWSRSEETFEEIDFDEPLLKEEMSEKLDDALRTMNPIEAKYVISHYGYSVSYDELAKICDVKTGTLRARTVKSLEKIKKEMRKYSDDK